MASRTGTTLLRAHDAEACELLGSAHFYPYRLNPLDTRSPFDWVMNLSQLGPMWIADSEYGSEVRVVLSDLGSYHVNIPLTGSLVTTQRGATVTAMPTTAAVYQPVGATVLDRWAANSRMLSTKISTRLEQRPGLVGLRHTGYHHPSCPNPPAPRRSPRARSSRSARYCGIRPPGNSRSEDRPV
ncbi:MAG TPA: hypothetical protein VGD71_18045 [Kribbella sp.]